MELGLSLGEAPAAKPVAAAWRRRRGEGPPGDALRLGFCMGTGGSGDGEDAPRESGDEEGGAGARPSTEPPPLQLELLPFTPVIRQLASSSSKLDFLWSAPVIGSSEWSNRGLDVNQLSSAGEMDGTPASSPPNSAASSFQMDFAAAAAAAAGGSGARHEQGEAPERASSRASDEEENGSTRKKLRLSKEQSAFLEESFKEHNTLNPKQKMALAKQLNLRPRQVEVWFQNRRARTKLKQTEVDCEYLKSCCEKLTEENRRLHKELQELRALKSAKPFYMQLPATTLTMCPSCERVATASTATTSSAAASVLSSEPATGPGRAAPPPAIPLSSPAPSPVVVPARAQLFPAFPAAAAAPHTAHPSTAS